MRLQLEERLPQHRNVMLERLEASGHGVLAGEQFLDGRRSVAVVLHQLLDLALQGDEVLRVDVNPVDDADTAASESRRLPRQSPRR